MHWRTNNATFTCNGEVVHKRYFRSGSGRRDYILLREILSWYPPTSIGGWVYRPLNVYAFSPESNELDMERLTGKDLRTAFIQYRQPELFYHAGCWLGLLHKFTTNDAGFVITFKDFNRSNVVIDDVKKEVVGVDPGGYQELYSHPSISLVMMVHSVFRGAMKEGISYAPTAVKNAIKGYEDAFGEIAFSLSPGFIYVQKRLRKGSTKGIGPPAPLLSAVYAKAELAMLSSLIRYVQMKSRRQKKLF